MKRIPLNLNWQFSGGDVEILETRKWEHVDLPHDFMIGARRGADADGQSGNGYFPGGMGEYCKRFASPDAKTAFLMIDGAYMNAEVFLNGDSLFVHPYGYTPFWLEITELLNRGSDNLLRIVAQSRQPGTRWYSGGGLYREISLLVGPEQCVLPWEVYARCTACDAAQADVCVDFNVRGAQEGAALIELFSPDGRLAARAEAPICAENRVVLRIGRPQLWSVDNPALYSLRIALPGGDEHVQKVGLRSIHIDARSGFTLNGSAMKLRGGCIHHDNGPLGAVSLRDAELRKIRLLKKAGYNAIRCAHNPPSQRLLEACDELGMLVMDEAFDCWNEGKNPQDYHLYFRDWWERDVESMVLSARNHPCVFSYSIGNEIPERDGHGQGARWARTLADKVRSLDPERPVTCGVNGLHRPGKEPPFLPQFGTKDYASLRTWNPQDDYWGEKTEAFCEALDFVGYNYMHTRYAHDRKKYPNRAIVATESFPALTHAYWEGVKKNSNVFGDFIWTAFDYLGEAGIGRTMYQDEADRTFPAAYPWHQANTADFSICGLRTAQSYYREIMWGLARGPHLRATSPLLTGREFGGFGWNWDDSQREWNFDSTLIGKTARVDAYADADEVEFLLNGKSLGRSPVKAYIATVEIPYAPGKLEARAYRRERLIGTDLLETNESATQMTLKAEPHTLTADGMSLCYIELTLRDKEGRIVTNEDRTVLVRVRGAGMLAALGTDDPLSEESYADCRRRTLRGRLLIVLRSGDASGIIEVTAECGGMTAILPLPVAAARFDASFSMI